MAGREVAASWRDRTIRAWLPDPVAHLAPSPEPQVVAACERARQAVLNADARTPTAWEPLARLLLRAEGVASSYIEGVSAPLPDVALAEIARGAVGGAAAWVAANLQVLDDALAHAHSERALDVGTLNSWHRDLMAGHTDLPPAMIGALRNDQGWIGGSSPLDAALVTPPPDLVPGLVDDLLGFLQRRDIDPITQAAVAHAQFEVVHPYGDGNGRLGRILILWVLARRTGVRVLPPVSTRLARDPGAYLAGMTQFRLDSQSHWIRWFADTVADAARSVVDTVSALTDLASTWHAALDAAGVRRDATARALLADLPREPVLSSRRAAVLAGVSERAARTALDTLESVRILAPVDTVRSPDRYRWWYAPDVAALVTAVR